MHKNIVLLSDGTGNSSASPFKTNVWRLYQALDIAPPPSGSIPEQCVYYDNGVGTENFKPLAALGGAFGIGVWDNVKDLYMFVCRSYQIGDRIYGFGFSRGAFTIRLLMGLIGKCGIVVPKPNSEAALIEAVEMAYEAYRRDFLLRASRERHMIYHWFLKEPRYDFTDASQKAKTINLCGDEFNNEGPVEFQSHPQIAFVGVWDTVDAYGMPVDELKMAIDQWVWPMSFADRDLSLKIDVVRHALSLDDERPTFRPVLWNEIQKDGTPLDQKRIQQVWFSGVHANVGGGYPDDGLAHVALDWMMTEAERSGLRFDPVSRREIASRVSPQGEQYDSRAGVAGYYRYGPRDVATLVEDKLHNVHVPVTWLHVDAFDRIARHLRDYAPVSFNAPFQLTGGNPALYPPTPFLTADLDRLDHAWDIIWWRRLAYFATLETTAFVALFFAGLVLDWPNRILDCVEKVLSGIAGARVAEIAAWIFRTGASGIAFALPGWLTKVLPSFSMFPLTAVLSLTLLAVLFIWVSSALQARIGAYAEWAWSSQKGLPPTGAPEPNWLNAVAGPGRKLTGFLYWTLWRPIVVHLAGFFIAVVAIAVTSPIWIIKVFRRRPWMA